MKFLYALLLFSFFSIHSVFSEKTESKSLRYLLEWKAGNYYPKHLPPKSSETYRKTMLELITSIRDFAKNKNEPTDENLEITLLKNFFPATFTFYGQSITIQLQDYLPDFLFPAIGNAAQKQELDHFCITDEGNSYSVSKNDKSLGMLLPILAKNRSSIDIVWCPLDFIHPPL